MIRKYPELEELFCFPCSPYESKYLVDGVFKICKSYAYKVWNVTNDEDLKKPTTRFDNCGFMIIDEQEDIENALISNGYVSENETRLYLPSQTGLGFKEYMESFVHPILKVESIEIVDSDDITECFTGAYSLNMNKGILLLILFLFYLC